MTTSASPGTSTSAASPLTHTSGGRRSRRGHVITSADRQWPVCPPVAVTVDGRLVRCDSGVPGRLLDDDGTVETDAQVRAALWRMGLARWAASFHPLPLALDLLAVDLLAAADAAWLGAADVEDEAGAAADLAQERLVRLARRSRAGTVPPEAADQVRSALDAALRWIPLSSPAHTSISDALDIDAPEKPDAARSGIDPGDVALLGSWAGGLAAPAYLSTLPHSGQEQSRWRTDVDWAQVPAGVLDPAEGTVEVTIGESPRRVRVEVRAAAHRSDRQANGLRFRVMQPEPTDGAGWELLCDGTLQLDRDRGVYAGHVRLSETVTIGQHAVVDVYDVLSPHPPRVAAARRQATGQRHAAHAVAYERLAAVATAPDNAALYRLARNSWSATVAATRDNAQTASIAATGSLRCLAEIPDTHPNIRAQAERLARTLPTPPQPNETDRAAARPLLAELALAFPELTA